MTWTAVTMPPPMFNELYADVIIQRLTNVMGALATLTVIELEGDLHDAGVDLQTTDCLTAKRLIFQSLEYSAALASVVAQTRA